MSRTLLIDADIIAYQSTAVSEQKYDWGDTGGEVKVSDFKAACKKASDEIDHLAEKLKATSVIVCLSDDVQNFREEVWPGYKQNRVSVERPQHLYDLKEWLGEEFETRLFPRMEADDVMGILSTEPHEGERIIVSADKDMQTVPGLLFNPQKDKKVRTIDPEFAERFMLWQALTGDQTDGYKGCPDVGPKAADMILDHRIVRVSYQHQLKSGPRKGEFERRRTSVQFGTRWQAIVEAFLEAGLGLKDAIQQVNLARILKHSDVDGNRIIPWVPSMLSDWAN